MDVEEFLTRQTQAVTLTMRENNERVGKVGGIGGGSLLDIRIVITKHCHLCGNLTIVQGV